YALVTPMGPDEHDRGHGTRQTVRRHKDNIGRGTPHRQWWSARHGGAATGAHNGAGVWLGDAATVRNRRPDRASPRSSRQEGRGYADLRRATASARGRNRRRIRSRDTAAVAQ